MYFKTQPRVSKVGEGCDIFTYRNGSNPVLGFSKPLQRQSVSILHHTHVHTHDTHVCVWNFYPLYAHSRLFNAKCWASVWQLCSRYQLERKQVVKSPPPPSFLMITCITDLVTIAHVAVKSTLHYMKIYIHCLWLTWELWSKVAH